MKARMGLHVLNPEVKGDHYRMVQFEIPDEHRKSVGESFEHLGHQFRVFDCKFTHLTLAPRIVSDHAAADLIREQLNGEYVESGSYGSSHVTGR